MTHTLWLTILYIQVSGALKSKLEGPGIAPAQALPCGEYPALRTHTRTHQR